MGSDLIDDHHKALIQIINELDREIHDGPVSTIYLAAAAKKLEDYTAYHFQLEEAVMKQHHYPEYEAHKEEHEAFIQEVQRLKQALANDALGTALRMTSFLKSWLLQHILIIDKEYSIYFQQKGIHVD